MRERDTNSGFFLQWQKSLFWSYDICNLNSSLDSEIKEATCFAALNINQLRPKALRYFSVQNEFPPDRQHLTVSNNRWITALFTCRLRTFPLKCFVSNKTHFSSLAKTPDARLAFSFSPCTFLSDWSPSWCLMHKHSQPHMNMSHTEDNQTSLFLISCPYACHGSSFKLFFFFFLLSNPGETFLHLSEVGLNMYLKLVK